MLINDFESFFGFFGHVIFSFLSYSAAVTACINSIGEKTGNVNQSRLSTGNMVKQYYIKFTKHRR